MTERQTQSRPRLYFDLREAMERDGCPLCRLLAKDVQNYLSNMLYENVNDADVRSMLRQSFGLCRVHSQVLTKLGDPLGIAILYKDILEEIYRVLSTDKLHRLSSSTECPACSYRERFEKLYIETLADNLHDAELKQHFEKSRGLCMNHLSSLIERIADDATKEWLLLLHGRNLDTMRSSLSEYVRKQDIQFKNEPVSPEEESSCEKAITFLVGKND